MIEKKALFKPPGAATTEIDEHIHLAQITKLLGPPPPELLARGRRTARFYGPDGMLHLSPSRPDSPSLIQLAGNPSTKTNILASFSLENSITKLEGEDKRLFLNFVRKMLQWDPKKRSTALELLDDPWVDRASRGT